MPVAVCDNRIWITFGIFTAIRGGPKSKKKKPKGRGKMALEGDSTPRNKVKQTSKQNKTQHNKPN